MQSFSLIRENYSAECSYPLPVHDTDDEVALNTAIRPYSLFVTLSLSVSYTHLDVYKRQTSETIPAVECWAYKPKSYTGLVIRTINNETWKTTADTLQNSAVYLSPV